MPIHCAAVTGDCTKLMLLLELDTRTGGKMKEALKDEMIEVHKNDVSSFYIAISKSAMISLYSLHQRIKEHSAIFSSAVSQ